MRQHQTHGARLRGDDRSQFPITRQGFLCSFVGGARRRWGGIKGNRCAFLKCLIKNDARKRSLRREREQDLPTLHTAMADGMSAPLQTQINESRDWER